MRFVHDCRAQARRAAGCAEGYSLAGEKQLSRLANRIASALELAADEMEALASMEAVVANRVAQEA